jgi:hypothetical protein
MVKDRKDIRLGWKKSRFHLATTHKAKLVTLPPSVDLSQYIPPVRDQGQVGSCTGFGIGGILGTEASQNNEWIQWYSPEWIYNGARELEGTLFEDAGAEPIDCFTWLTNNGCLLEEFWPYNPNSVDTSSPDSRKPEAMTYPSFTAVEVDNGIDGIMSALADGHVVAVGSPWFDSWMNIGSDGVLPAVTTNSSVAGGHETFLYGYDSISGSFLGQNSWGTSWGNNGHYKMPMSAFAVFNDPSLGGYDAHYVIWNATPVPPVPAPIPTPPPSPSFWTILWNDIVNFFRGFFSPISTRKYNMQARGEFFVPVKIADIISGSTTNPTVKHTHVEVSGTVLEVKPEQDLDHHIWLSDGTNKIACEIIPELPLQLPAVGSAITIDGLLRYDYEHNWWEVHPVCQWK